MGRKPKKDGGAEAAPKATIEDLSDDQRYSLVEQHRRSYEIRLAAKKAADKSLKDIGKIIKTDLGKHGMDQIKAVIEAQTPEGEEAIKTRIGLDAQVLRWLGVPIGTQADMFPTDRTPIGDRAFAEGKRQGLAGEKADNQHHVSTEAHRRFNDGFAEGQQTLATKGFTKLDPKESADVKAAASLGSARPTFEVAH